jgi:hypothetical protein
MKLLELSLVQNIATAQLAGKHPDHPFRRLALPLRDQVCMHLVPGRKLRQRLLAPQGLKGNFRLEGRRKITSLCHASRSSS